MKKILDLRFVIGLFFTIIGLILLVYGFVNVDSSMSLNKAIGWGVEDHSFINRWCGIVFTFFGVIMIVLSFMKDANDELVNER